MILENPSSVDDKKKLLASDSSYPNSSNDSELDVINASGSRSEREHLLIDVNPGTANALTPSPTGPPPDFSTYQAEHFGVGYDDIVSHDPHLNSDGEALYRFLLDQCASRPLYRLHCRGTHNETRTRWVARRDSQGRTRHVSETYSDTITDFDFCLDIVPGEVEIGSVWESHLDGLPFINGSGLPTRGRRAIKPVQWTVPDDEPAYRGKMVREYEMAPPAYPPVQLPEDGTQRESTKGRRTATRKECKAYKAWRIQRSGMGFPPWVRQIDVEQGMLRDPACAPLSEKETLRSSKTLRQWADEYCASPKYLKEFVYSKEAYGWNMQQIESAVRATIQGTPYNGQLTIEITPHNTKVYIRPDNALSRMFSNKWLKFLSIILFIFPFVWLYKRFHPNGGGRWEVCGAAYALKQWVPVESEEDALAAATELSASSHLSPSTSSPNDGLPAYEAVNPPSPSSPAAAAAAAVAGIPATPARGYRSRHFIQTPTGTNKLIGIKEGEWYKSWEGAIARAVVGRYQSNIPLPRNAWSTVQAQSLDGYNDTPHPSSLVQF